MVHLDHRDKSDFLAQTACHMEQECQALKDRRETQAYQVSLEYLELLESQEPLDTLQSD